MRKLAVGFWALVLSSLVASVVQADGEAYKKLYEEAYVIKDSNPSRAKQKLRMVLETAPIDSAYYRKALKLIEAINASPASRTKVEALVLPPSKGAASDEAKAEAAELRKLGSEAYKKGDYAGAIAAYRSALRRNPRAHDLYRLLGSVHARMGHRKAAYRSYSTFVERCPDCDYAPMVKKILDDYRGLQSK